jgi:transposase
MPRPLAERESLIESVKALVQEGCTIAQISEQTGVHPKTAHSWISRNHWRAQQSAAESKGLKAVGERVRAACADELERYVSLLQRKRVASVKELSTGSGRVATLGRIIESSATLFDWGKDDSPSLIVNGSFSQVMMTPAFSAVQNAAVDA